MFPVPRIVDDRSPADSELLCKFHVAKSLRYSRLKQFSSRFSIQISKSVIERKLNRELPVDQPAEHDYIANMFVLITV